MTKKLTPKNRCYRLNAIPETTRCETLDAFRPIWNNPRYQGNWTFRSEYAVESRKRISTEDFGSNPALGVFVHVDKPRDWDKERRVLRACVVLFNSTLANGPEKTRVLTAQVNTEIPFIDAFDTEIERFAFLSLIRAGFIDCEDVGFVWGTNKKEKIWKYFLALPREATSEDLDEMRETFKAWVRAFDVDAFSFTEKLDADKSLSGMVY